MNKYYISALIRKLGLIRLSDKSRFYIQYLRTYRSRRRFFKMNPGVKIPPAYFVYETFKLDYSSYYNDSFDTAKWLVGFFEKHKTLKNLYILDWGCGPGRIVRHMPALVGNTCRLYATDYNKKYIEWCQANISDVSFGQNQLAPPTAYEDNFFDIIYGISIFTHLSEEMHYKWFNELMRILKPNAILFLTMHGDAFKIQLSETEKIKFDQGELVVKSNTKEGHRTFGAYHPIKFINELIGENEVLEHIAGEVKNGRPQQDIWIIKKNKL